MRITIITTDTAVAFMRRAGYGYQKEGGGEVAFVRRVGGGLFPRYHAYTKEGESRESGVVKKTVLINLHIDQKAPTYGRNSVHSGEYEGALVEQEAARFRAMVQPRDGEQKEQEGGGQDSSPGFWKKLFS